MSGSNPAPKPVAFVGDAHLRAGESTVGDFVRFVDGAPTRFSRLVLVGDIFDLWLARPRLHEEHHVQVLEAIRRARQRGLPTDYAVGNRDFGVEGLPSSPFERVTAGLLSSPGHRETPWLAEHGDLVNEADRQYRLWRRFARSGLILGSFLRLPSGLGVPLSQWLERRMRTTNMEAKRRFPLDAATSRASRFFRRSGARFLVLGHFHEELRFTAGPGEVLVLPDWKRHRRHAEWHPSEGRAPAGEMRYCDSLG